MNYIFVSRDGSSRKTVARVTPDGSWSGDQKLIARLKKEISESDLDLSKPADGKKLLRMYSGSYFWAAEESVSHKHSPGGKPHNQARHGWRFGSLDKVRRSLRGRDQGERDEYRKRAGMAQPKKVDRPKVDPAELTDAQRAAYQKAKHSDDKTIPSLTGADVYKTSRQNYPLDADHVLKAISVDQGFAGKPAVVSKTQMDKLVADGDVIEIHRGMNSYGNPGGEKVFVEQYRSGDLFAGTGIYGNGTYTSPHRSVAMQYANNSESGMIRLGLRKDAKIGSYSTLKAEMAKDVTRRRNQINAQIRKLNTQFNTLTASRSYTAQAAIWDQITALKKITQTLTKNNTYHPSLGDVGRYAATKGYDAYRVDDGSADHIVILNRTATYAER